MRFLDVGAGKLDPRAVIEAGLRTGTCDVALVLGSWAAKLGSERRLLDLTPYARVREREFFPATLAANAYQGHQWAMPREAGVSVLYVRPEQAARPPQTWEAMFADKRPGRRVAVVGDGGGATSDTFLSLFYAAGGRVLTPDGRSAVNGAAGRRALDTLLAGWASGAVASTPDESISEVLDDFRHGDAAFLPTQSRLATYLLGARKLAVTLAQVPHFAGRPPRPLVATLSVAVSADAHNRGMAIRYLNWLTSPEVMQNAAEWSQASPLRESYGSGQFSAVDKLDGVDAIRDALEHGVPYPSTPAFEGIFDAIGRNVHRALTGSATAAQALRNMEEEINSALAGDAAGDAS
jgi:ABC-type glycerol-3-phosphate transport system substrate-binding protein